MQVFRIARYVFIGPLYYYVYETVAFETPSIRTGKWFQIVGNAWPSTWQTRPHKSSIKTIAIVKAKESVHPNTQHSSTHRQCCAPFFMSSHAIKNGAFSACHIIVYIKYMAHHVATKILARINKTHATRSVQIQSDKYRYSSIHLFMSIVNKQRKRWRVTDKKKNNISSTSLQPIETNRTAVHVCESKLTYTITMPRRNSQNSRKICVCVCVSRARKRYVNTTTCVHHEFPPGLPFAFN